MTFDASYRGTSSGGLSLVGARVCVPCGAAELCRRSKPADAVDWMLAKGGRSLTAGGIKLRAEAGQHGAGEIEALMARIVRVPELELEVERLRELMQRIAPPSADLIARSSIGAGLRNIREHGIDDEIADLEPPRRARNSRRKPPEES